MARTGRPSKINDVVAERPVLDAEGQPTGEYVEITVAEQIVQDVRTGLYAERAARRAGIATSTFYDWEKRGREARRQIDAGQTTLSKLPAMDRRCLEFSEAVEQAEAEWEARANVDLERLSRGGVAIVETTVKVGPDGNVLEERTKTTHTLPDAATIEWRLERRFPDRYGRRTKIEGTGDDGAIPVELRAKQLGEALREHAARAEVEA